MGHGNIWGHGKEVKESDMGGWVSFRKSKEPEVVGESGKLGVIQGKSGRADEGTDFVELVILWTIVPFMLPSVEAISRF